MNIKRIIKEEIDKKIPYEYYINKILDEVEEYIDIDKLKKKEYLFKVVDGVYKSLITLPPFTGSFNEKYFYRVNDEKEMHLLILNILIDRFNIEKSLNESDELEWIKDVKSNQDIAQEIADKTDIKDNEIDTPFTTKKIPNVFSLYNEPSDSPLFSTYRYFHDYCEKHHGLNDITITHDIWKRYKKMVMDKINDHSNLNENESDELELNTYEKNISYIRSMKTYEYIKNNIDMFDRVYSNTEYIEKTGERLTWRPTGEDLSINNLWMKKTIDRLQFLFMDDDSNKRFNEELIEYYDKVDYDSSLGHLKDREDEIKIGVLVYSIIRDIVG